MTSYFYFRKSRVYLSQICLAILIQYGSLKEDHLSHIWILSSCVASEILLLVQLFSVLTILHGIFEKP